MIVEYLRYDLPEDRQEEFMAAYRAAAGPLRASEHCLAFEMARCVEAPGSFILRIEWASAEAHLEGFRRSAEFREFLPHVRPYLDVLAEMRHYAVVDTG